MTVARTVDLTIAEPRAGTSELRFAALWCGGWLTVVLVMAGVVSTQKDVPFGYALRSEGIHYVSLAGVSVIVWFASAAIARRNWPVWRRAAAHVAIGLVLTAAWQALYGAYMWSVMGSLVWAKLYRGTWMFQVMNAGVLYGAVLGGTLAVQSGRRAREHERRQHELALAAREAELRALNAQLEPHFLLNTLNSVLALVDTSPRDARQMIERLSELLKAAFDEMEEAEVPLGRELDLLEAYLGIEQVRFADRLRVTIDVPEDVRGTPVPPFLLQPIVENAIKHAVAPLTGPAFINVQARRVGDRIRIEVADSGRGFEYQAGARRGRGLELAERRLKAHAASGELHAERGGAAFTIVLTLPA